MQKIAVQLDHSPGRGPWFVAGRKCYHAGKQPMLLAAVTAIAMVAGLPTQMPRGRLSDPRLRLARVCGRTHVRLSNRSVSGWRPVSPKAKWPGSIRPARARAGDEEVITRHGDPNSGTCSPLIPVASGAGRFGKVFTVNSNNFLHAESGSVWR